MAQKFESFKINNIYIEREIESKLIIKIIIVIGSPVWKPRDSSLEASSTTLPRKGRDQGASSLSASRKSLVDINTGLEIHNSYHQQ